MTAKELARHWSKEPLVHFLIGGALIYALFAWRGEPPDPASRSIEVSREDRAQLSLGFEKMMGRSPTDAELDRQTQKFVREEVLYREALRLGLDVNDGVVRRRMSQKMDLIAAAQAETAVPSEQALQEWYEAQNSLAHRDKIYCWLNPLLDYGVKRMTRLELTLFAEVKRQPQIKIKLEEKNKKGAFAIKRWKIGRR